MRRAASWSVFAVMLGLGVLASPALASQCNDGIDNDGDGLVDYDPRPGFGDPGCSSPTDDTEQVGVQNDGCPDESTYTVNSNMFPPTGTYKNVKFTATNWVQPGAGSTLDCTVITNGQLEIEGDMTVKRTRAMAPVGYGIHVTTGNVLIQDVYVDPGGLVSRTQNYSNHCVLVNGGTVTLNRVEVTGCADGFAAGSSAAPGPTVLIQDSLCHDLNPGGAASNHTDCFSMGSYGSVHITGTRLDAREPSPKQYGAWCNNPSGVECTMNSVINVQSGETGGVGEVGKVEVDHSWLDGGGYQFYAISRTSLCPGPIKFHDNVWGSDRLFGSGPGTGLVDNGAGLSCPICPGGSAPLHSGGAWFNNVDTSGRDISGPGGECGQSLPAPPVLLQ